MAISSKRALVQALTAIAVFGANRFVRRGHAPAVMDIEIGVPTAVGAMEASRYGSIAIILPNCLTGIVLAISGIGGMSNSPRCSRHSQNDRGDQ